MSEPNPLPMQRWLLMVCLLPCLQTNAQNPHGRAKEKYAIIFVEPLAALDYSNGQSIRAGAEYRLGRQWSVSATGGVYLQEGYIVRTELKWLMPGVNELNFISLEYEYISHLYTQ